MNDAHPASLPPDLNLLRVFAALMEERSVTRAGERLALSQSAVSHALARLRLALSDELFVRGSDGMRPTPRALEIAPGLSRGLAQIQESLQPRRFDPATATTTFRVAASAYFCAVVMPAAVARFRSEAPEAHLSLRQVGLHVAEALDLGRVDLAFGVFGHVPARFQTEPLMSEAMVWALSAHHADARSAATRLPRLAIAAGERDDTAGGRVLDHGLELRITWDGIEDDPRVERPSNVRITAPDSSAALAMLPGSDLTALVPRRLAGPHVRAGRLAIVEPDPPLPVGRIAQIWRRERDTDSGLAWLRALFKKSLASEAG